MLQGPSDVPEAWNSLPPERVAPSSTGVVGQGLRRCCVTVTLKPELLLPLQIYCRRGRRSDLTLRGRRCCTCHALQGDTRSRGRRRPTLPGGTRASGPLQRKQRDCRIYSQRELPSCVGLEFACAVHPTCVLAWLCARWLGPAALHQVLQVPLLCCLCLLLNQNALDATRSPQKTHAA